MRTRYHYRDGALERIELCFDDGAPIPARVPEPLPPTIDAMPATLPAEALPEAEAVTVPAVEEASGTESVPQTESYSLAERIGMGTVRGSKMGVFGAIGEAAAYGVDNVAKLGLPPGTGFAIGCVLYGVNKALVPKNGGIL